MWSTKLKGLFHQTSTLDCNTIEKSNFAMIHLLPNIEHPPGNHDLVLDMETDPWLRVSKKMEYEPGTGLRCWRWFVVVPCCHCVDSCCALSVSELHLQSLGLSGHVKRQAKVLRGTWARRIRWHVLYDSMLSTSVYRCIQHLRHFQTQYLLLLHSILEFLITTPRFVALFDLTRCDYAKSKMCVRVSDQRPKVMLNKLKSNHILPWISKWDQLPYHTEIRWHDDWLMLCCIAPYLAAWDLILPM